MCGWTHSHPPDRQAEHNGMQRWFIRMSFAFLSRAAIKADIINTLLISKKKHKYICKILERKLWKMHFPSLKAFFFKLSKSYIFLKTALMEQKKQIYFLKKTQNSITVHILTWIFKIHAQGVLPFSKQTLSTSMDCSVATLRPTLWDPMDYCMPGSSVLIFWSLLKLMSILVGDVI